MAGQLSVCPIGGRLTVFLVEASPPPPALLGGGTERHGRSLHLHGDMEPCKQSSVTFHIQ